MSAISITATSFIPSDGATLVKVRLGGTVAVGDAIYKNASGVYVKAQANAAGTYAAAGLATASGVSGQYILMLVKDTALAIGATVAEGTLLAVSSAAAGAVIPSTDLTTGDFQYIFGTMLESNIAKVDFANPITTASAIP